MYYIGLDVHKKTISYCVKDASGQVHAGRHDRSKPECELDWWMKTLPQPWTVAMEATIFTGWIYDHLLPHAAGVKVAHPVMLRAIALAKKKNDRIDAGKIADCLRCDFLPECHMASTEIRDRRRSLRYRHLLVRQMVQMKNRVSGLAAGIGSEPQQATAAQGGVFPGTDLQPGRSSGKYPAAAETEPGDDRTVPEDGVRAGEFSRAGSAPGGKDQTTPNGSRSGANHRAHLGVGDRGRIALPISETGHQLLRVVRGREEFRGQGACGRRFPNSATNISRVS